MKNKIIGIVIGVIVILGVVAALTIGKKTSAPASGGNTAVKTPASQQQDIQVNRVAVPPAQAPESFPANIPIEAGAKITQNENATTSTGLFQATRTFVTAQSLDENFKLYSDFLQNNGWKLISSLDQANLKVLAAQKGKGNLQVTINQNTATQVKTVSITYSEQR